MTTQSNKGIAGNKVTDNTNDVLTIDKVKNMATDKFNKVEPSQVEAAPIEVQMAFYKRKAEEANKALKEQKAKDKKTPQYRRVHALVEALQNKSGHTRGEVATELDRLTEAHDGKPYYSGALQMLTLHLELLKFVGMVKFDGKKIVWTGPVISFEQFVKDQSEDK